MIVIKDTFLDRVLLFVSCFAFIITMGFVSMILIDLNNIWVELIKYQQKIENLETLIMIHNKAINEIGCNV